MAIYWRQRRMILQLPLHMPLPASRSIVFVSRRKWRAFNCIRMTGALVHDLLIRFAFVSFSQMLVTITKYGPVLHEIKTDAKEPRFVHIEKQHSNASSRRSLSAPAGEQEGEPNVLAVYDRRGVNVLAGSAKSKVKTSKKRQLTIDYSCRSAFTTSKQEHCLPHFVLRNQHTFVSCTFQRRPSKSFSDYESEKPFLSSATSPLSAPIALFACTTMTKCLRRALRAMWSQSSVCRR